MGSISGISNRDLFTKKTLLKTHIRRKRQQLLKRPKFWKEHLTCIKIINNMY